MQHSLFIQEQYLLDPQKEPLPVPCFSPDHYPATLPELSNPLFHLNDFDPDFQKSTYRSVTVAKGDSLDNASNSIFDDLVSETNGVPSEVPSSVTYRCRRLVLAKAAATLQTMFTDALNLSLDSSIGSKSKISAFNFETFETAAWTSEWEGSTFTKLWEQRENLELLRYKLRQNIQTITSI
jgi:hypothetical protein